MKKNGYILILTIIAITALIFFGILYLNLYRSEKNLAMRAEHIIISEEAATAGIEDAIYQLKKDPAWTAGFANITLPHSKATYAISFDKNQTTIPYSTNNKNGTQTVTGYNGRTILPGYVHIVSLGKFGISFWIEEALLKIGGGSIFQQLLFSSGSVELQNTTTDSFNSALGTYAQTHQNNNGNIGTNLIQTGSVEIKNSTINGNVVVGPGGTTNVINSSNSTYQGLSVLPLPINMPIISPPSLGQNLGNFTSTETRTITPGTYSKLTLSGSGQITFQPGVYIFTDEISITGNTTIVASGPVVIYALGSELTINGNSTINTSQIPSNFIVYGGQNLTDVTLNGQSQAYIALYAPSAEVTIIGGFNLYGGIVAKETESNGNSALHYDTSLQNLTNPNSQTNGVTIKSRW